MREKTTATFAETTEVTGGENLIAGQEYYGPLVCQGAADLICDTHFLIHHACVPGGEWSKPGHGPENLGRQLGQSDNRIEIRCLTSGNFHTIVTYWKK